MRCKVILINKETNKRSLAPVSFSSRKKAEEWCEQFKASFKKDVCDYEIKPMQKSYEKLLKEV